MQTRMLGELNLRQGDHHWKPGNVLITPNPAIRNPSRVLLSYSYDTSVLVSPLKDSIAHWTHFHERSSHRVYELHCLGRCAKSTAPLPLLRTIPGQSERKCFSLALCSLFAFYHLDSRSFLLLLTARRLRLMSTSRNELTLLVHTTSFSKSIRLFIVSGLSF